MSHPKNIDSRDPDLANLIVPSKINFVDLSGAERGVTDEGNSKTIEEGTQINKSLFALSKCINALTKAGRNIGMVYVPYRDSKLTRFLKDSLGGTTRTTMICHISPSSSRFNESSATLKYAEMAKMIPVLPKESIRQFKELQEQEYRRMVHELRQELDQMRSLNGPTPIMEELDHITQTSGVDPMITKPAEVPNPQQKTGQAVSPLTTVPDKSKVAASQQYYSQKETKHMLTALKQENDLREMIESNSTRTILAKLSALLEEEVELKRNLSDLEAHRKMNDTLKKRYKERISRAVGGEDVEWVNEVYNELKQSDEHNEYVHDMLTKEIKDNKDKVRSFVVHAERELGEAKAQLLFKEPFKVRDDKLARIEMETHLRLYESLNKKLLDRVFEAGGPAGTSRDQPQPTTFEERPFRPRGQDAEPSTNPEFNLETSEKRRERKGQAPDMDIVLDPTPREPDAPKAINSDVFDMDADAGEIDPRRYELKGIKDQLKDPTKNRYVPDEDNQQQMSDSEVNLEGTVFNQLVNQDKQPALFKSEKGKAAPNRPDQYKQDATIPKYGGRGSEQSKSILDKFQQEQDQRDHGEIGLSSGNFIGKLDDPTSASKLLIGAASKPKSKPKPAVDMFAVASSLPINLQAEAQTILASAGLDEASMQYLSNEPLANPDRETSIKFGIDGEQIVRWNLNVAWGEEYKLYLGGQGYECFPETKSVFEGELLIDEPDFLGMLDSKELALYESMYTKKDGKKRTKNEPAKRARDDELTIDDGTAGGKTSHQTNPPKRQLLTNPTDSESKKQLPKEDINKKATLPELRAKSREKVHLSDSHIESPEETSKARRTGSILDQFLPEAKEKRRLQSQSSFEKQISSSNQQGGGIYSLSQSRPGTLTQIQESRQQAGSNDRNRRQSIESSEEGRLAANPRGPGVKLPKLKPIPQHQLSYNLSAGDNNSEGRQSTSGLHRRGSVAQQDSISYKPKGYDAGPDYQEQDEEGMVDFDLDDGAAGLPSNIHIDLDDIKTSNREVSREFSGAKTRKQESRGFSKQQTLEESLKEDFKKKFTSKFPQT